jgi:hypothetical protein
MLLSTSTLQKFAEKQHIRLYQKVNVLRTICHVLILAALLPVVSATELHPQLENTFPTSVT